MRLGHIDEVVIVFCIENVIDSLHNALWVYSLHQYFGVYLHNVQLLYLHIVFTLQHLVYQLQSIYYLCHFEVRQIVLPLLHCLRTQKLYLTQYLLQLLKTMHVQNGFAFIQCILRVYPLYLHQPILSIYFISLPIFLVEVLVVLNIIHTHIALITKVKRILFGICFCEPDDELFAHIEWYIMVFVQQVQP